KELEGADANVAGGHAREHRTGQALLANHRLAGGYRSQRARRGHAEGRHRLAEKTACGPRPSAEGRAARHHGRSLHPARSRGHRRAAVKSRQIDDPRRRAPATPLLRARRFRTGPERQRANRAPRDRVRAARRARDSLSRFAARGPSSAKLARRSAQGDVRSCCRRRSSRTWTTLTMTPRTIAAKRAISVASRRDYQRRETPALKPPL